MSSPYPYVPSFFHRLSPAEHERLVMLWEEANEVGQACAKILRHGYESYNPDAPQDGSNREQLRKEITQFVAVTREMIRVADIRKGSIEEIRDEWDRKLRYAHHQKGTPNDYSR